MGDETQASILLVEDSATQALQLSMVLEAQGYRVERAASAEGALEALNRRRPDLLIVDYRLPGMNGDELARQIRMNADMRGLPLVMLTDEREGAAERRGLDSGVNAYVPKAAEQALLLARLRSLLKRRGDAHRSGAGDQPGFRRARLLIVAEAAADRALLSDLFQREGYELQIQSDAAGAVEKTVAGGLDGVLIVLDASAFDALALVRGLDAVRAAGDVAFELVGLSRGGSAGITARGFDAGLDDMFPLGDDAETLTVRVRSAIRRKLARDEEARIEAERMAAARAVARAQAESAVADSLAKANRELAASNAKLRETQAQLVQAAKMASLGELVAGIAHEINNPLAFIVAHRDTVARIVGERAAAEPGSRLERAVDRLDAMGEGLRRIRDLVTKLGSFSRLDEGGAADIDVPAAIDGVLVLLAPKLRAGIDVTRRLEAPPRLSTSPAIIDQVFMNLVANAADALGEAGGRIEIATRLEDDTYLLSVGDSGPGIPPALRDRIFEPFFTTKDVGSGTGLGLAIAYGVVQACKGRIEIGTAREGGALFTVSVPFRRPA